MISFITVNYKGDIWMEILLESIEQSMSHLNYEVVVVCNSPTKLDYGRWSNIKLVDNTNTKEVGSRGHADGLSIGYNNLDKASKYVILVDQDIAFLSKNWDKKISDLLSKYELVSGVFEDRAYNKNFFRPYFMAFVKAIFDDEIKFREGLYPNIPIVDTAGKLSQFCFKNKLKTKVLPNSRNWPKQYDRLYDFGESIYLEEDKPLCHHVGRSVPKNNRSRKWSIWVEEYFKESV